jgi:hypothetical protein
LNRLGTPKIPAIRFAQGVNFVAYTVHAFATACQVVAPCTDPTGFPAVGDFYHQASNGSVALPVAGYNYNSDWTPLLAGLAPIGMAASLAALDLFDDRSNSPSTYSTQAETSRGLLINALNWQRFVFYALKSAPRCGVFVKSPILPAYHPHPIATLGQPRIRSYVFGANMYAADVLRNDKPSRSLACPTSIVESSCEPGFADGLSRQRQDPFRRGRCGHA